MPAKPAHELEVLRPIGPSGRARRDLHLGDGADDRKHIQSGFLTWLRRPSLGLRREK
jgi:hypothetical protein